MSNTEQCIASLAAGAKPVTPLAPPGRLAIRLLALLLTYALGAAIVLTWREDLLTQLARPFYLAELTLLFAIAATSLVATIHHAFPDGYQQPAATRGPLITLALFIGLTALGLYLPADSKAVMNAGPDIHKLECTLCIAGIAFLPSTIAVFLLRKGASTSPISAGACAVLAATATGCLVLRLIEANDDIIHLITWHYLPTFAFAALGGVVGKTLLKW